MTKDEISKIKEHIEIHSRREPRAIKITEIMWKAVDELERIAEQEELLNSTLEENKDIYKKMADLDTALEDCTESLTDARIKIKELEKENEELKDKLSNLASVAEVRLANWQKYEKENAELKEQIEKMKCCENYRFSIFDTDDLCVVGCNAGKCFNHEKWELQEN